jgi:hypothetical protein
MYAADSVLACPSASSAYGVAMTRTYAMNGVGHNRRPWNADPNSYDTLPAPTPPIGIRLDAVSDPSVSALALDAARNEQVPPLPIDRCASVIDFRPEAQMAARIGRFHRGGFNAVRFDGSVGAYGDPPGAWDSPLP